MDRETAVITGGSRGIGRAVALKLAERDCNTVINYAGNKEKAEETAALCREYGVSAVTVQGDIARKEDCERILQAALENFDHIDILVNNAGITRDNIIMRMSDEEFDAVIDTNLRGTYHMMKLVSRPMMKQRYGRIVSLASVVGLMGNIGQINYAASKAGVIGMTKSLARELASRNVTVNAVAPGFIETDMTAVLTETAAETMRRMIPQGRPGTPEEVAAAVCFLTGREAGYITGQVLCVDGGMCM